MSKIFLYSYVDKKPENEYTIDLAEEPEITLKNVYDTFMFAREHYKDFSGQFYTMEFRGYWFHIVRIQGQKGKRQYRIYPLGTARDVMGLRNTEEVTEGEDEDAS
jgi:hypothetical protein